MINYNENEMKKKNKSHINTPRLDMDTNLLNVKSVQVCWCLYVSSKT